MAETKIFLTSLRICRQFPKIIFHEISLKSFFQGFVDFQIFKKIDRKLTENFLRNYRPRVLSKVFSRVLELSVVFREF